MSVESGRGRAQRDHGNTAAELTRLIEPVVAEAGFDLEDVDIRPAGRRRLVKIVVDSDGGVSLDDVATVNHAVSAVLDETDVMGSAPYVLEVTSPGVDRPLTEPRHWRRAAGRLVKAPLTAGGQIEGRVVSADDAAVVMDVRGRERKLRLDELGGGKVQVEFRRTDDPAQPD